MSRGMRWSDGSGVGLDMGGRGGVVMDGRMADVVLKVFGEWIL